MISSREIPVPLLEQKLCALGRGISNRAAGEACRKQHLALVRYADSLSWQAVAAMALALQGEGVSGEKLTAHGAHAFGLSPREGDTYNDVGVLSCSALGPRETMNQVASSALQGAVSPLRFPAANPGSFAGVACIVYGLRGPTLNLTMPPQTALATMQIIANAWLKRGLARELLLLAHVVGSPEKQSESEVRCLRLALLSADVNVPNNNPLDDATWEWWAGVGQEGAQEKLQVREAET